MAHRLLAALVVLASAVPASADVWEDPDLDAAVARAALVVRVRAPEGGSTNEPVVRFTVVSALKGTPPGTTLDVGGLHDPTAVAGPVLAPREELYLVLDRGAPDSGAPWRVPTPTLGRFPVRDGRVQHAVLRDTFLRLTLDAPDFEAFLALLLGRSDEAWLARLRADLGRGAPTQGGETRTLHYLALEALARVGGPGDVEPVQAFLREAGTPFQLRISAARALARAGGRRAAGALERLAAADPEPAVRTAAVRLLAALDPPPEGLVAHLAALLETAPAEPVRFAGPQDPRLNQWPAPKVAVIEALGRLGPAPARDALVACLGDGERLDVSSAALRALLALRDDPDLPLLLVARLRAGGTPGGVLFNDEVCAALSHLTSLDLGPDPAAWRTWADAYRAARGAR